MRKALLAFSLAGIICGAVYADGESTYKVIKGDTLSKIAGKMYNDPNQWPKIMEANKNILANPNAIAVGQVLTIPALSAAKDSSVRQPAPEQPQQQQPPIESPEAVTPVPAPEEQVAEQVEEPEAESEEAEIPAPEAAQAETIEQPVEEQAEQPAPGEEKIEDPKAEAPVEEPSDEDEEATEQVQTQTAESFVVPDVESFVAPETWQGDGHIASEKDKKLLISTGDTVYINVGAAKVAPGSKCVIYRVLGKVQDQNTRDILGNEVRRIGRLRVMDAVGASAATAKVTISYDPIQIGDIIAIVSDAQ